MCGITAILIALGTVGVSAPQSAASPDRSEAADIDLTETEPTTIRVADQDGQPIEQATLKVEWWQDTDGNRLAPAEVVSSASNQRGEATIEVPAGAATAQISVAAQGFAKPASLYSLGEDVQITLSPGRILRIRAIDAAGNPLPDAIPLLENSRRWPREFEAVEEEPGVFVSPLVALDRHWMRVVDAGDGRRFLYSNLIDVQQADSSDEQVTIVTTLRPGIRLRGKLDDSVPRPIYNGLVELYIREGEDHRIGPGPSWTWQDTVPVRPDGTFVFPSLPAGGHAQLVALVDGYQSTRPALADLRSYLTEHEAGDPSLLDSPAQRSDGFWPHLFPLPDDQDSIEVTLPCQPTCTLDVAVVDPLGSPIPEAEIMFNPNGYFLGGELFIPGSELYTEANRLRKDFSPTNSPFRNWATETYLRVKTDAYGTARVRSLPADVRESYRVEAEGYVMPIHPLSIDEWTTRGGQWNPRYAAINLVGGETLRRTITMERLIERSVRDLSLIDSQGDPVPEIEVTVTELAFAGAPDDWELWATQRFGAVVKGRSAADGRVRLHLPTKVHDRQVAQLRIVLRGRMGEHAYVQRRELAIAPTDDGRVVLLEISEEEPKEPGRYRDVDVRYVDPADVLSETPQALLAKLQKTPSIAVLKRLLRLSKFDEVTPLEFCGERNLLEIYSGKDEDARSAVISLQTEGGPRVVVLCDVRPQEASWEIKPELRFPPEAAFVFSPETGKLLAMLGGWKSAKDDYNDLFLTNMGGTDDYFVEVSASEEHGPFVKRTHWYRLGDEQSPALTTYNDRNSTSWSGKEAPATPLAEFGHLGYEFNGRDIDRKLPGVTPEGAQVPRKLYWDGSRNRFIGPTSQSFEGDVLYRVVTEQSSAFEPLEVEPGQIVIGGGRREYKNWHLWDLLIPEGRPGLLRLLLIDERNGKTEATEVAGTKLEPGLHVVQLHIGDAEESSDDEPAAKQSLVELRIDAETLDSQAKLTVPRVPVDATASVPGTAVARTANERADLFNRPTIEEGQRLIWRVELE